MSSVKKVVKIMCPCRLSQTRYGARSERHMGQLEMSEANMNTELCQIKVFDSWAEDITELKGIDRFD